MRTCHRLLLLACLPLGACNSEGLAPPGDGGAAPSDSAVAACSALHDEVSCSARADCMSFGCPPCTPGGSGFIACLEKGTSHSCPAHDILCPPTPCSPYKTESDCNAAKGCVPTFADPGTCDCSEPGCCNQFDRCVPAPVQCSPAGTAPCSSEPWNCGRGYAPIYNGQCQASCVRAMVCGLDCRTQGCATGANCTLCWGFYSCLEDGSLC